MKHMCHLVWSGEGCMREEIYHEGNTGKMEKSSTQLGWFLRRYTMTVHFIPQASSVHSHTSTSIVKLLLSNMLLELRRSRQPKQRVPRLDYSVHFVVTRAPYRTIMERPHSNNCFKNSGQKS